MIISCQSVLEWLFKSTLNASVLVAVIFLAKAFFRTKLSIKWHDALWLLLIFRMIFPWGIDSFVDLSVLYPQDIPSSIVAGTPLLLEETVAYSTVADSNAVANWWSAVSLSQLLVIIWALGGLLMLSIIFKAHLSLHRRVRRDSLVKDESILRLFGRCKESMGLKKSVDVVSTKNVSTPALFGFLRPRILLPSKLLDEISPVELRYVFLHELAHIKRNDVLVRWIGTALMAVHWFNPLVWAAFYRMRQDREMAADGLTLSLLREGEAKPYGITIILLLQKCSKTFRLSTATGLLDNVSSIRRRVKMISAFERGSYRWSPAAVCLFALLISASVWVGNAPARQPDPLDEPEQILALQEALTDAPKYLPFSNPTLADNREDDGVVIQLAKNPLPGAAAVEAIAKPAQSRNRGKGAKKRPQAAELIVAAADQEHSGPERIVPKLDFNSSDPLAAVSGIGSLTMNGRQLASSAPQTGHLKISDRALLPPVFETEKTQASKETPTLPQKEQTVVAQKEVRTSAAETRSVVNKSVVNKSVSAKETKSLTIEERIALYNANPDNKYYPITCRKELPTGRNIPRTVCRVRLKTGNYDLQVARIRKALREVSGIRVDLMRLSDRYVAWIQ